MHVLWGDVNFNRESQTAIVTSNDNETKTKSFRWIFDALCVG